jgi:hypothetical protein
MTDNEKRELDRWLEWAGGEANSLYPPRVGRSLFEARVRKDGQVLRAIDPSRYEAIHKVKTRYEAAAAPATALKARCASCPQDAVEEFTIRCSEQAAATVRIVLVGPWVDTTWEGSPIREETVPLCQRCMAVELRRHLSMAREPASWLKAVRA